MGLRLAGGVLMLIGLWLLAFSPGVYRDVVNLQKLYVGTRRNDSIRRWRPTKILRLTSLKPLLLFVVFSALACDTKPVPNTDSGVWTVSRRVSPVDSSVDLSLSLQSIEGPEVGTHLPFLAIDCDAKNGLNVSVDLFNSPSEGGQIVKYRFDQTPPVSEEWFAVTGGAVFPPDGLSFLKKLMKARKLTFESSLNEVGIFDLLQLPNHLDQLKKDCNAPGLRAITVIR